MKFRFLLIGFKLGDAERCNRHFQNRDPGQRASVWGFPSGAIVRYVEARGTICSTTSFTVSWATSSNDIARGVLTFYESLLRGLLDSARSRSLCYAACRRVVVLPPSWTEQNWLGGRFGARHQCPHQQYCLTVGSVSFVEQGNAQRSRLRQPFVRALIGSACSLSSASASIAELRDRHFEQLVLGAESSVGMSPIEAVVCNEWFGSCFVCLVTLLWPAGLETVSIYLSRAFGLCMETYLRNSPAAELLFSHRHGRTRTGWAGGSGLDNRVMVYRSSCVERVSAHNSLQSNT